MEKQNTKFEIANNFKDLKEKLHRSINGSEAGHGYIEKMINNIQPVKSPMGQEFDTTRTLEMTPDGGFNLGYYSPMSGDTMVSIRLFDNKITLSRYHDNSSGKIVEEFDATIEPIKDGSRSVVNGSAEMFVKHEDDVLLNRLLSEGVGNLLKIDGKGENNLTPEMKKQLISKPIKSMSRSR